MFVKHRKWLDLGVLIGLVVIFILARVNPLIHENVAYTYDQGRDFLKATEIARNHDLTFIGPTTGIIGIFHGAWWYYLLAIPNIIFNASPIGYYYFMLFIALICFFVLNWFLGKFFDCKTKYLGLLIVATSGYFVGSSIFAGNNVMVLPVMIGFLISNFYLIENKVKNIKLNLFFIGLFLGFIAEFEFAFGLMLIPVYLILSTLIKQIRQKIYSPKQFMYFFGGLAIPFLPRLLFELRHEFSQTMLLIGFFFQPKFYNPKPYVDIINDRLILFEGYFKGIFNVEILFYIFLLFVVVFPILYFRKNIRYFSYLSFLYLLAIFLFIFSTFYKDNFWGNYYEGIHYIFLFFFIGIIEVCHTLNKRYSLGLIVVLSIFILSNFFPNFHPFQKNNGGGLIIQKKAVEYIIANEKNKEDYCVKIYTPPAIPHTYNYLFKYYEIIGATKYPSDLYKNSQCWFILETDPYKFRREQWIKDNFFKEGKMLDHHIINKDIEIYKYEEVK
jgi:hypothetical protein